MSYYRKHRPSKIHELDLKSVRESMYSLSANLDDIPHAFLFSGPRGSGKTSSARILAKLVNCQNPIQVDGQEFVEPCSACDSCKLIDSGSSIDVVEIDAASNRGIDDIRALRESVNLAPANSKYKFYIMDEAHMLTSEAANAFLKTLEEPPSHAIFVLATTDPQKLPETVHSRLTKINFRKASAEEIKRQIARVAESEKIVVTDKVLDMIISRSDGSFRDAVKLLEMLVLETGDLSEEKVFNILDHTSKISFSSFWQAVAVRDIDKCKDILDNYSQQGGDIKELLNELTNSFRRSMFSGESVSKKDSLRALKLLIEARENLRKSHVPEIALEIFLAEWCGTTPSLEKVEQPIEKELKKKPNLNIKKLDELSWAKILSGVREKNASIETLLRAAKPMGVDGDVLNLGVYYRFHKERLETTEPKRTLEEVVENVLGGPLRVVCSLKEKKTRVQTNDKIKESLTTPGEKDIISAAKEIFG